MTLYFIMSTLIHLWPDYQRESYLTLVLIKIVGNISYNNFVVNRSIARLNELRWVYMHIEIEIIVLYRFIDGHHTCLLLNFIMHGVCWQMEHNHFINTQMILHFRYEMSNFDTFSVHIICPFNYYNIQQKLPTNRKCKQFWHNLSLCYT